VTPLRQRRGLFRDGYTDKLLFINVFALNPIL